MRQFDIGCACLSGAYVFKGFRDRVDAAKWEAFQQDNGEIELVDACSRWGEEIERMWAAGESDDAPGVWDYEVSEPLGWWIAKHFNETGRFPSQEATREELRDSVALFWSQVLT